MMFFHLSYSIYKNHVFWSKQYTGRKPYMNLVMGLAYHRVSVAQ